jgi:hypothetical protein
LTASEAAAQFGSLHFAGALPAVYEDEGEVLIEVVRTTTTYPQQVKFSAYSSSTARNFVPTNQVMTFLPGVSSLQTKVQLLNDDVLSSSPDYARLTLEADGQQLDSRTLTILEDKASIQIPGSVTYCGTTNGISKCVRRLQTRENDGQVKIPLTRTGNPGKSLSLSYITEDGSARMGRDFLQPSATIEFQNGETTNFISIPILDNTLRDGTRTFRVWLSGSVPACVFSIDGAEIQISDDDIVGAPGTYAPFSLALKLCSTIVNQIQTQSDGSLLVGTDCYDVGYLLRINADGAFLPFAKLTEWPDPFWYDSAGAIYFSGRANAPRTDRRLRKLSSPNGTEDSTWAVYHDGTIRSVMPLPDGKLLLVGTFTSVNDTPRPNLAMLLQDGSLDPQFKPDPALAGSPAGGLVEPDGSAWIFGVPANLNGTPYTGGVRMRPDGSLDFSSGLLSSTYAGAHRLRAGRILANDFQSVMWMPDGAQDETFVVPNVNFLNELPDGRLLVFNQSYSGDGLTRRFQDGSPDSSFKPTLDGSVNAAEPLADGKLLIGGRFETVNGIPSRLLAKLHLCEETAPTALLWNGFRMSALEGTNCQCVILRDGNSADAITVSYRTVPGTATPGIDYVHASGEITFAPGERWRPVTLNVLRNTEGVATNRTFSVMLSCTNDTFMGVSTNLAVTILDRDLHVRCADARASEASAKISVPVTKTAGISYSALLQWELLSSDSQPLPFAATQGVLSIPPGTRSASIDLRPLDDTAVTGPRAYALHLVPLSSNVTLEQDQITVTLLDNDLSGFTGDGIAGRISGFIPLGSGEVLAWGNFASIHGESRKGIAALDARTGRLAAGFQMPDDWLKVDAVSPAPDGGFIAAVTRVVSNQNVYAVERFSAAGNRVAPAYDPLPGVPTGIALSPDGSLYAWGYSSTYNGTFTAPNYSIRGRGIMAKYDAAGKRDTNFITKLTYTATAFFEPNGDFWLGGGFSLLSEAPFTYSSSIPAVRNYFGKFTPQGTLITNAGAVFDTPISKIVRSPDGHFYATGGFADVSGLHLGGLARLTPDGQVDTSFVPTLSSWFRFSSTQGMVSLTALPDGSVLTCVGYGPTVELTIYETNGALRHAFGTRVIDLSSSSFGSGGIPVIPALDGSVLFIAGDISAISGKGCRGLGRLWMDGKVGTDGPFDLLGASVGPGGLKLDMEIRTGGHFELQQSSDLENWEASGITIQPQYGRQSIQMDQPTASKRFFRISWGMQ